MPTRSVTVSTLHSGNVTVGTHSLMVTESVLAAMNQTAAAARSTNPIVRSLMSRPFTVSVDGLCACAVLRAINPIINRFHPTSDL